MPDNTQADPVAPIKAELDGLRKDITEKFASKSDASALNTKLVEIEGKLKDVEIKVKDRVLDEPLLGLFKDAREFWYTGLCAMGARNGISPEEANKKIYGDGGYVARMKEFVSKSPTGFNEAFDADGGIFLVPQIASGLLTVDATTAGFPEAALNFPVSGLTYSMNALVDKNHSTSVAGGVTVSRKGEGVSPDKSKSAFEQITWKVTKQSGYTDITDEMMEDASAVAAIIPTLFAKQFAFVSEGDFLYDGSGAGEPLAALHANNPAVLTVPKEAGQAADTIVLANLLKMRSRVFGYSQSYWYATQDIIPQVAQITLGNAPIFLPSGKEDVSDTILGRPVKYTEHASALGDLNDIALVNPTQYGIANRQGVTMQESIHVRFLQGEKTIKFTKRNDGQPLWKSVLTPKKGLTRSPFVNLEAR